MYPILGYFFRSCLKKWKCPEGTYALGWEMIVFVLKKKKKNDKCSKCSFLRHSPTTRSPKLGSYDHSFLPRTPRSFKHSASSSITDELIPTLWRRLEVLRRRCIPILDTFFPPIFRLVFKKKMMKPYPQKKYVLGPGTSTGRMISLNEKFFFFFFIISYVRVSLFCSLHRPHCLDGVAAKFFFSSSVCCSQACR